MANDKTPAPAAPAVDRPGFVSAGLANDIAIHGQATDPANGRIVVADGDGYAYQV